MNKNSSEVGKEHRGVPGSIIPELDAEPSGRGFTFPKWHGDKHVGIGFDSEPCPLCAAIQRIESQKAELDSVAEILAWFTRKLDAIKLDGTTPQDAMAAFREIVRTCKMAKGMARLAK